MTVLHFFTLPELADDLEYGTVRVESLVQHTQSKTPGLATRIAQVHVRAEAPVPEGTSGEPKVLTFMLHLGHVQVLHGKPADDEAAARLDEEAERAVGAVKQYLRERGFEVRSGLIDIGSAEPVRGTWAGLDLGAGNGPAAD